MADQKDSADPRVIIIGAGVGGLMMAIALKKRLNFQNFIIYEQSDDLGGTWNLNTYPGCASDVATHWYSLSSDLNPDWDTSHVYQPQLKAYWKQLSAKYGISGHIVYFTQFTGAEWDSQRQMYRTEITDMRSGETRVEYTNIVISAIGCLNVPFYPEELRGIQTVFKGAHFHSARWNHSVDLRNKRVAVIGNGCSASQFVPLITEDPTTQVVNFCRTPNWILPKASAWREPIPVWKRRIFKYVPFAMRLYRWALFVKYESTYVLVISGSPDRKVRKQVASDMRKYIQENAPEKYHDILTPKYAFGCKRFIVDSGYLEAFHRPNNELNYDGIAEVIESGILTKKGEHFDFDVIIQATGFVVDEYPIKVRGVDGSTIQDYFRERGGPTSYRGTAFPNFPNFYTLFGPNMATGHGSVIHSEESQVNYLVQMLQPILSRQVSSFEVTHAATDDWNAFIQRRLGKSVWSVCQSWYRVGHSGKNCGIWPGTFTEQWWSLRKPIWSHYKALGASQWESKRFWKKVGRILVLGILTATLTWMWTSPTDALGILQTVKAQVKGVLPLLLNSA
ncbi:hypothetical protein EIP91_008602 [Steccherinum ochraceum]|uniref:L-ornithine N(5)-oxygenase n=1 Tax=Steccherinum ochraceum TaxID=92696 RepID=A0A4R0RN90_9APHY|nr:hypothetical protein EIP91_008602 [Steccherinum ochraceum]